MYTKRTYIDNIFLVLKGIAMGAANKVPGVSGGLVAFTTGFYEEFIYSLQRFNTKAFKLLFNGRFKSFNYYINGSFLAYLITGMVISYFSVSKILDFLIDKFETQVWSTFFGMVIGSIFYILKDFKSWNLKTVSFAIMGTILGLIISFIEPSSENDNLIFVFFCGMISITGMTLPGLSGSFILLLIGNYKLLLIDSVNELYNTINDFITIGTSLKLEIERLRMLQILFYFTTGSIVGLVTFSHLLNYIIKKYKEITTATIVGFILGSLGILWPWKTKIFNSSNSEIIINYDKFIPSLNYDTTINLGFITLGGFLVLWLDWYGNRINKIKK
jgi:putative membrane protein